MEKNIDILKSIYQKREKYYKNIYKKRENFHQNIYQKREILLTKHKNSKIIEYRNKKIIFHKQLYKKKSKSTQQNCPPKAQ